MCITVSDNQSQSYGASPAIWDHTVLPATGTSECGQPKPQTDRQVLDLPTQAELTLMLVTC